MPDKFKSYSQAYQYLCRFTDYERMEKIHYGQTAYNLKRMKCLLSAIGNPQDKLRCIHIAGTKGKGSTAIMIAQILSSAGYRVGLYTSPHLVNLHERIQVWHKNKKTLIPKNDFTQLLSRLASCVMPSACNTQRSTQDARRTTPDASPTFFELMTAISFLYFTRQKTDFAVIEVGLGGRLDATNLINPLISVITRIDFDHIDKLGNTIKKIAYEKAGIIKKDTPVVTFKQNTPADRVIQEKARSQNAPLYITKIRDIKLPVSGNHQQENCSLALSVINILNKQGYTTIKSATIRNALRGLILPARLELVQKKPDIIIDSAHNLVSIRTTTETIRKMKYRMQSSSGYPVPEADPPDRRAGPPLADRNLILIFALSRDKEIAKILKIIFPLADTVIFTRTNHPRLLQPEEFLRYLPVTTDKPILLESDYRKALKMAQTLAQEQDLILICGSFYLAGPVRNAITKHNRK